MNSNYIESTIGDLLLPRGFQRRKNYWFKDLGAAVVAIDISKRGPLRNIGFGVWLKQLEPFRNPSDADFHWGGSSMDVNPKYHTRAKCFDYADKSSTPLKKRTQIERFFTEEFLPFVLQFDSLNAVCEFGEKTNFAIPFPRKLWKFYEAHWKPMHTNAARAKTKHLPLTSQRERQKSGHAPQSKSKKAKSHSRNHD